MNQHAGAATYLPRNMPPCNDSFFNPPPVVAATVQKIERNERFRLSSVDILKRQSDGVLKNLAADHTDLARYLSLIALSEQDQTLFYYVVMSDPERFIPFLYDPAIANACLAAGHLYRRPRGLYITRGAGPFRMSHSIRRPLAIPIGFTVLLE